MKADGSTSSYRDELAAARARVASLEEQLAEREQRAAGEDDEEQDPVLGRLLGQRRAVDRRANQQSYLLIAGLVLILLMPMLPQVLSALRLDPVDYGHLGSLGLRCAGLGVFFAVGLSWLIRTAARAGLPTLDAKIAEARRMRSIERRVRELPAGSEKDAQRVRIAVEDEGAEEEVEDVPALSARGSRAPRGRSG